MSFALLELLAGNDSWAVRNRVLAALAAALDRPTDATSEELERQIASAQGVGEGGLHDYDLVEPFMQTFDLLQTADQQAWAALLFLARCSEHSAYGRLIVLSPFTERDFAFVRKEGGNTKQTVMVNDSVDHMELYAVVSQAPPGWSLVLMGETGAEPEFVSFPIFEPVPA